MVLFELEMFETTKVMEIIGLIGSRSEEIPVWAQMHVSCVGVFCEYFVCCMILNYEENISNKFAIYTFNDNFYFLLQRMNRYAMSFGYFFFFHLTQNFISLESENNVQCCVLSTFLVSWHQFHLFLRLKETCLCVLVFSF